MYLPFSIRSRSDPHRADFGLDRIHDGCSLSYVRTYTCTGSLRHCCCCRLMARVPRDQQLSSIGPGRVTRQVHWQCSGRIGTGMTIEGRYQWKGNEIRDSDLVHPTECVFLQVDCLVAERKLRRGEAITPGPGVTTKKKKRRESPRSPLTFDC